MTADLQLVIIFFLSYELIMVELKARRDGLSKIQLLSARFLLVFMLSMCLLAVFTGSPKVFWGFSIATLAIVPLHIANTYMSKVDDGSNANRRE